MARLRRYRKALFDGVNLVASVLTIAVVAGGASWLAGAIWPVGVVAAETLALVIALGWVYFSQRAVRISEADQKLLDELLNLLSRPSMQRIEENDFAQPWPRSIMFPVRVFVEEYGDVEHQFDDKVLETTRVTLYQAAMLFLEQEAVNAWSVPSDLTERYVGLTGGEVEGDEEKYKLFEQRYLAIFGHSRDFLSAHTELVALAKRRGCSVAALRTEAPHPTVHRLEERDRERRASTTSDPRTKW
jgi:hypothetical protein